MGWSLKTASDESLIGHVYYCTVSAKISFAGILIYILHQLAIYKEFYVNKCLSPYGVCVSTEVKCKKEGLGLGFIIVVSGP